MTEDPDSIPEELQPDAERLQLALFISEYLAKVGLNNAHALLQAATTPELIAQLTPAELVLLGAHAQFAHSIIEYLAMISHRLDSLEGTADSFAMPTRLLRSDRLVARFEDRKRQYPRYTQRAFCEEFGLDPKNFKMMLKRHRDRKKEGEK